MKYGFIGLGNIGMLIATDLANSGHDLTVYDIVGDSAAELGSMGAQVADSPADVAQNADIIGICVRDAKDVRDVMEGSNGILSGARQGLLVAIHSTIGIDEVRGIAAKAQQRDVRLVDAPVSRGPGSPSRKGIVFMVGGAAEDVARVEPYLASAALKIVRTGGLGTGMALKLCNNLLSYTTMVMANDAMRMAEAAGLDVQLLVDVTSNNGLAGPALTSCFMRRTGAAPPAHFVPPPPEALIGLGEKDLDCALEEGRNLGIDLPSVEMSRAAFRQTVLDQWTRKN
jgi:3-hydroxyisobutyrate dehydrogenase-like beta-hydroxyacid dehydrogenase